MNLKLNYLSAQKHFSKYVCKYRRQFSNKRQLDLLQQQKYNPKVFWRNFSQLGGSGFSSGQTVQARRQGGFEGVRSNPPFDLRRMLYTPLNCMF